MLIVMEGLDQVIVVPSGSKLSAILDENVSSNSQSAGPF